MKNLKKFKVIKNQSRAYTRKTTLVSNNDLEAICQKFKLKLQFKDYSNKWYSIVDYSKKSSIYNFIVCDLKGKQYKMSKGILYQYSRYTEEI